MTFKIGDTFIILTNNKILAVKNEQKLRSGIEILKRVKIKLNGQSKPKTNKNY